MLGGVGATVSTVVVVVDVEVWGVPEGAGASFVVVVSVVVDASFWQPAEKAIPTARRKTSVKSFFNVLRQILAGYATIVVALDPPSDLVYVTLTRSPTLTSVFRATISVRSKL